MNMIDSLGDGYFQERYAGSWLNYNGGTYVLDRLRENKVQLRNVRNNEVVYADRDFFQGFKVFEYPKLGWRRMHQHAVGYVYKTFGNNRYNRRRGIFDEVLTVQLSPVTHFLYKKGEIVPQFANKAATVMSPVYDKVEDIAELIRGERTAVVLSEDVLIEPNVRNKDGMFNVFYGLTRAGHLLEDGKVKYMNEEYKKVLQPVLGAYA